MKKQKLTQDEVIYLANFLMVEAVPSFVPPRSLPERRRRVAREGLVRKHILESTAKGLPWAAGSDSLTQEGADVALAALIATMDEWMTGRRYNPARLTVAWDRSWSSRAGETKSDGKVSNR